MRPCRPRTPWLVLFCVLGCQSPPDIGPDLTEYVNLANQSFTQPCDCPVQAGYASMSECFDQVGQITLVEHDCMSATLDGHEEEAQEFLDCANVAYRNYVDCLAGNVNCVDGAYDECQITHNAALGACPQLPGDVRQSFLSCDM